MANLFDYINWRGDLDFSVSPFNEVDNLLLSQISYIDFGGVVPEDFSGKGISMEEAAKKMESMPDFSERSRFSTGINEKTMELFLSAAKTKRYSSLMLKGFIDILDQKKEEQFSAMTYSSRDWNAVVFRGTDGYIIGWKEDCKLGCMDEIPAQKDALEYLEKACSATKGKILVCGHSKGGNLAIYSATKSQGRTKKRIEAIYNNDGPGFGEDFFRSGDYISIEEKIHTFVPKLSIVGMLFCQTRNIKVVTSDNKGAMQHDPLSWNVGPTEFPEVESTAKESRFISTTVNGWINNLSLEQRNEFVEGIFSILDSAQIKENDQFKSNPLESFGKIISAFSKMDGETKHTLQNTMYLLVRSGWENLKS